MVFISELKPADEVQIRQETRITWPTGNDWPTPGQIKQLGILVKARYPGLAEGINLSNHFKNGLLFLLFSRRRSDPDPGRAMSYWNQVATDWLEHMGIPGGCNVDALLAAAACHGISYTAPPYSMLGLTLGSYSDPQPSSWHQVLETGRVPGPVETSAPKMVMPSELLIVGGNKHVGRY